MKLIHLSDLHIGKRVNEFSMLEDQRYILDQMMKIFAEQKVDGVLIAGDVYDKTVPSAEAVQLFDEFITGLAKAEIPVYMISGNHDSAERLSFGAKLFESSDIYISQVYDGEMKRIVLKDQYGPISVYLLPFLKPAAVRHALQRDDINTYEEGVMAALQECEIDTTQRNVLVAHQFVTGADRSDSEETSVGGLDNVSAEVFKDFDYVALGHIHRPQKMGRETLRYSGTPLKYSFSEADHKKSVTVVELLEKGNVRVSTVPLIPRRDMRKLRGTYMDVTAKDHYTAENKMDYLQITLTDEEDVPGALQKLRTVYPNLMRLEYDNKRTRENREVQAVEVQEQKSELELFEEFYELLNNEPMKEEQTEFVEKLIQDLCWNEDRFIRGFTEDGEVIGQRTDPEANMWLNPQSWSVISGLANEAQADLALQNVYDKLNTEYGAILMDPPYHAHAFDGALAVIYNAGTKENAGIFSQSQGWIILAEALRGHGERAFNYFIENAPAAQNNRAEIRRLEPYCYGQFTEGKHSPNFGRSHVHWLTGTASTVMVGCVEGILGMRPDFYGLKIAPSVPKEWEEFEIEKDFRGSHLHIVVKNPGHAESGCEKLFVNGEQMKDNYIPQEKLTKTTEVELFLS